MGLKVFWYVANDARKMVIQYNSHQETEMSILSLPARQVSDLIEIENRVTFKEADNHISS